MITEKVCLVTGANAGIGKATALGLAQMGATIIMVCRNLQKGQEAQAEIKAATGNSKSVNRLRITDYESRGNPMKWFFRRQPKEKQLDRIMNVGDDDFKVQVLQRSYKMPVMVDFWASWCGPCRQLGPVLERVADAKESGFVLAKLDTEANQKTAVQYRIQSIPAVKVFRNGQIVGEFVGGMPEANIRKFMDKIITAPPPSPHMKVAGKPAKRLQQAIHHLQKGRGFEAFVLLLDFPHSPQAETVQKLLPLARFLCDMDDGDGLTGNSTLDELYLDVVDKLLDRDPAAALAHLANALGEGTESQQARTKEVISAILALLGDKHELSQQYLTLVA